MRAPTSPGPAVKSTPPISGSSRYPAPAGSTPCLIIRALRLGFDGVLVSGCHPGDCHYQTGNYRARRRMAITKKFLEYVGVEPQRVQASWVSASEGGKFAEVVTEITSDLKEISPNRLFIDERDATEAAE